MERGASELKVLALFAWCLRFWAETVCWSLGFKGLRFKVLGQNRILELGFRVRNGLGG